MLYAPPGLEVARSPSELRQTEHAQIGFVNRRPAAASQAISARRDHRFEGCRWEQNAAVQPDLWRHMHWDAHPSRKRVAASAGEDGMSSPASGRPERRGKSAARPAHSPSRPRRASSGHWRRQCSRLRLESRGHPRAGSAWRGAAIGPLGLPLPLSRMEPPLCRCRDGARRPRPRRTPVRMSVGRAATDRPARVDGPAPCHTGPRSNAGAAQLQALEPLSSTKVAGG